MDSNLSKWNDRMEVESMRAYDAHYVFFLVFEMACVSEDFAFREKIMKVIDRMYNPIMTRWPGVHLWRFIPAYNSVDASFLDELEVNLKRIQILERLKAIRLFIYRGVLPTTFIVQNEVQVLQNRWVYDQILKVILADRIMVLWKDREGLPEMPEDYRLMNAVEDFRLENPGLYDSPPNSLENRLATKGAPPAFSWKQPRQSTNPRTPHWASNTLFKPPNSGSTPWDTSTVPQWPGRIFYRRDVTNSDHNPPTISLKPLELSYGLWKHLFCPKALRGSFTGE